METVMGEKVLPGEMAAGERFPSVSLVWALALGGHLTVMFLALHVG